MDVCYKDKQWKSMLNIVDASWIGWCLYILQVLLYIRYMKCQIMGYRETMVSGEWNVARVKTSNIHYSNSFTLINQSFFLSISFFHSPLVFYRKDYRNKNNKTTNEWMLGPDYEWTKFSVSLIREQKLRFSFREH